MLRAWDLESSSAPPPPIAVRLGATRPQFDLIHVARYLHRELFPLLRALLKPGGLLIYHTFEVGCELISTPRNPKFLLRKGELRDAFGALGSVLRYEERKLSDGRPMQYVCVRKKRQSDASGGEESGAAGARVGEKRARPHLSPRAALLHKLRFREATLSDLERCADIEARSYPVDEMASAASLQFRIEKAAPYFRVALLHNTIVGYICATRVKGEEIDHNSLTSHEV